MTTQSEERVPDSEQAAEPGTSSARILPFERPQSDLQRAIQQRAQEAIDRDRDRDREKKKPRPLRWTIIFILALLPVVAIFGMVDGFLRALHQFNDKFLSEPESGQSLDQPAAEVEEPQPVQPGVVLLQPPANLQPAQKDDSAVPPSATDSSQQQSAEKVAPRQ